ncbi:hypothetical protein CY35_01G132600 [Sphagnum magellanicum]|nr:hypothetical protein CY35_01G132600 [Sphagnum magellanicum]
MTKLRPQFLLFDDSITQLSFENGGLGAALAALYARRCDSVRIPWIQRLLGSFFDSGQDFSKALPVPDGEHFHVPLPQYKENLHQIASHIKVKATPTHPSCPTSINCSSSIFHFSKNNWC